MPGFDGFCWQCGAHVTGNDTPDLTCPICGVKVKERKPVGFDAKCMKCGAKLTGADIQPKCPRCGALNVRLSRAEGQNLRPEDMENHAPATIVDGPNAWVSPATPPPAGVEPPSAALLAEEPEVAETPGGGLTSDAGSV